MMRRRATVLLGVVGLALLAAAAARVIYTSGAGIVTLMVIGAILLISPFVITRVERLSANARGLELPLAREIAEAGAPNAARILDRTDLGRFAESYAVVRAELAGPSHEAALVHLQDLLNQRAAALARQEKFEPAEVRTMFASASPAPRAVALGLMKGDPSLADGATILAAIADPRSPGEHYQGLELAKLCWSHLSRSYRSAIQSVIASDVAPEPDSARRRMAAEVRTLPTTRRRAGGAGRREGAPRGGDRRRPAPHQVRRRICQAQHPPRPAASSTKIAVSYPWNAQYRFAGW